MDSRSSKATRRKDEVPQLSCEGCRNRKVKCDKLDPCSNCRSLGVTCVPVHRLRLPRGRHVRGSGGVNEDLKRRIKRLEALVLKPPAPPDETLTSGSNGEDTMDDTKKAVLIQRPDHFWADLAEEIHGLRDVVDSAPNDATDDSSAKDSLESSRLHRGISLLGLSGQKSPIIQDLSYDLGISATDRLSSQLCRIYLQQVDPMVKILHRPSISRFMTDGERYLGYPLEHSSAHAIRWSINYAAASSLSERQCHNMFQREKSTLVAECRRVCESAIDRSGLLTTLDITVLQAFVLYLVARRSEERSRAVWTLLSVAVRIAKALSLNVDSPKETFFYRQMRRRLWLTICLMDIQSSFGQASQPLISLEDVSCFQLPAHINDSDFEIDTDHEVSDKQEPTDMTFAMMTYKLQLMGRRTNFGEPQDRNSTGHRVSDMQKRQQYVTHFEDEIRQLLRFCDPESSTYNWFIFHSAGCFVAGARACILRPLQRLPEGCQQPPPREKGDAQLLTLAVQNLEKALLMHTDPQGEGFRWYVTVQWHVLAITLAECYLCTDASLVRSVWPVVDKCYHIHKNAVGAKNKKLRGPLGRLFDRTHQKVAPVLLDALDGSRNQTSNGKSGSFESERDTELNRGLLSSAKVSDISQAGQECEMSTDGKISQSPRLVRNYLPTSPTHNANPDFASNDFDWIWEEFVADISFDDLPSPDMLFGEQNVESDDFSTF